MSDPLDDPKVDGVLYCIRLDPKMSEELAAVASALPKCKSEHDLIRNFIQLSLPFTTEILNESVNSDREPRC